MAREAAADAAAAANRAQAGGAWAAAERLRAELQQLRMRQLKTRAVEEGVPADELDDADDADDRQATIIELIIAAAAASGNDTSREKISTLEGKIERLEGDADVQREDFELKIAHLRGQLASKSPPSAAAAAFGSVDQRKSVQPPRLQLRSIRWR